MKILESKVLCSEASEILYTFNKFLKYSCEHQKKKGFYSSESSELGLRKFITT